MEVRYNLIFQFKTGDVIPSIRDIENSVNDTMRSFGFSEKMFFQSTAPAIQMTASRPLTQEEQDRLVAEANVKLAEAKSPFTCVGMELDGVEKTLETE